MFDYVLTSEDGETRIVKSASGEVEKQVFVNTHHWYQYFSAMMIIIMSFDSYMINLWFQDICNALPVHLSTPSNWVENQLKVIHE